MEGRRRYSPQYKPLLEERESVSETSLRSEAEEDGEASSREHERVGYEERVVIASDRASEEANGDADSGISLGEDQSGLGNKRTQVPPPESLCLLVVQIVIPFIFAGFGMMAAGLLLDAVQVSGREGPRGILWGPALGQGVF